MSDSTPTKKRSNSQPLTLELLKEHVPHVKAGTLAVEKLASGEPTSEEEKRSLLKDKHKASASQEILIVAALPLIKNLASKEFQRRRNWNSRISYDDLLQEAILGFMRGLQSYKVEATNVSPTNYLGQWINTYIRRRVEAMEHDLSIPYEVVERARRIRAVRSRLVVEIQREPTDEELLEALNAEEQGGNVYKFGKVKIEGEVKGPRAKQFTQKHLDEAYALGDKAYALQTTDLDSDSEDSGYYERNAESLTATIGSQSDIIEKELAKMRQEFFSNTFIAMRMGSKQKDVILRHFGLSPFSDPQLQKEIVAGTGYTPKFVKNVILAFSSYMPTKGGIFHQIILKMPADQIEDLELNWIIPMLGEWPEELDSPILPPNVLIQP